MKEKLKTVDAETLQATPMNKTMFIIEDLIPQGLTVLSGASKIGKSWLMLCSVCRYRKASLYGICRHISVMFYI